MFKDFLREMTMRTEGCLGALIMGTDGITVEQVWQTDDGDEKKFESAVTEYGLLIKTLTNTDTGFGKLHEVTLSSEKAGFIFRFINKDYFIAMVLSLEGNIGRGRYELKRAELLIGKELVF